LIDARTRLEELQCAFEARCDGVKVLPSDALVIDAFYRENASHLSAFGAKDIVVDELLNVDVLAKGRRRLPVFEQLANVDHLKLRDWRGPELARVVGGWQPCSGEIEVDVVGFGAAHHVDRNVRNEAYTDGR